MDSRTPAADSDNVQTTTEADATKATLAVRSPNVWMQGFRRGRVINLLRSSLLPYTCIHRLCKRETTNIYIYIYMCMCQCFTLLQPHPITTTSNRTRKIMSSPSRMRQCQPVAALGWTPGTVVGSCSLPHSVHAFMSTHFRYFCFFIQSICSCAHRSRPPRVYTTMIRYTPTHANRTYSCSAVGSSPNPVRLTRVVQGSNVDNNNVDTRVKCLGCVHVGDVCR